MRSLLAARQLLAALTLLAASVAHELGNPLNALSIHLQLVEREIRKLGQPAVGVEGGVAKRDSARRQQGAAEERRVVPRQQPKRPL